MITDLSLATRSHSHMTDGSMITSQHQISNGVKTLALGDYLEVGLLFTIFLHF